MNDNAKRRIQLVMHAFADKDDFNAQNLNAREIAIRLDEELFDIVIFYKNEPDSRLLRKRNVRLIKVRSRNPWYCYDILKNLLRKDYDIFFYVRNFYIDFLYFKLRKILRDQKKTIYWIENTLPYPASYWYNRIARANTLNSDYVFAVSKYVAETARREYGINPPVIHVGVDTSVFTPGGKKEEKSRVRVLFVGSLQERKRPDLVLEAAKRFPNADFILIGDGPLRKKLIAIKKKYNLKNVKLLGKVSQNEKIREYRRADIFLFPSIHEGFPRVLLEAAASGLPVIIFNKYKPESVIDGVTGFVVRDFNEMIDKLGLLISDSELRVKMGQKAREHIKAFSWDLIVKKWEKVFLKII